MKNFDVLEPGNLAEACAALRERRGEAKVYAGGSHLTILMKQGLYRPRALVNIKKIAGLRAIEFDPELGLRIGALATHRDVETSPLVRQHCPVLSEAEREVANIRVRNVGTIGGNLASGEPLTDLPQIFIALGAKLEVAGSRNRRTLPVEELFVDFYETSLDEDEIVTEVIVPPLGPGTGIDYIRFSSSSVVDKPSVGVAVRLDFDLNARTCRNARVVLGCVGATPVRAREAEGLLVGSEVTGEAAEKTGACAAGECSPVGDLRGSEAYKRAVVKALVKRAVLKAGERAAGAIAGES